LDLPVIARARTCLVLAIGNLVACGNALEPGDVAGTYALTAVNQSQLPFLLSATADCDEFIDIGELRLTEAGTFFLEITGPLDCSRGGGQPGTSGRFYTGSYDVGDDRLTFETLLPEDEILRFGGEPRGQDLRITVPPLPPLTGPDLVLDFTPAL
jgi:hypothetical protein